MLAKLIKIQRNEKNKKFTLTSDVQLLSTNEQKEIVGGDLIIEGCAHKTHEQCSGACFLDGYEGYATSEA